MGIELRAQLETELGATIDMGLLLSGPTIAELAAALSASIEPTAVPAARRVEGPTLTPIQPTGSRPPFFCVHPGALGSSVYEQLAELLPDQPFYSLCPQELEASYAHTDLPVEPTSIAQLATRCLASLRQAQPHGPYHLGGWSLGGVLAFEMATQLVRAGETVALLALFDSPTPTGATTAALDEAELVPAFASYLAARQGLSFPDDGIAWAPRSLDERLAALSAFCEEHRLFPPSTAPERLRSLFSTYRQGLRYATSHLTGYRPEVYPGRVVYFRATRALDAYEEAFPRAVNGWRSWTAQPLELVDIRGDHYSMFLSPHVHGLAAEFARVLHGPIA
jgi:thioesterase domain-containing protein